MRCRTGPGHFERADARHVGLQLETRTDSVEVLVSAPGDHEEEVRLNRKVVVLRAAYTARDSNLFVQVLERWLDPDRAPRRVDFDRYSHAGRTLEASGAGGCRAPLALDRDLSEIGIFWRNYEGPWRPLFGEVAFDSEVTGDSRVREEPRTDASDFERWRRDADRAAQPGGCEGFRSGGTRANRTGDTTSRPVGDQSTRNREGWDPSMLRVLSRQLGGGGARQQSEGADSSSGPYGSHSSILPRFCSPLRSDHQRESPAGVHFLQAFRTGSGTSGESATTAIFDFKYGEAGAYHLFFCRDNE